MGDKTTSSQLMSYFVIHIFLLLSVIVALMFWVRFFFAPYSPRIEAQIRSHKLLHAVWAFFGLIGTAVFCVLWNSSILNVWPPRWLERKRQREEIVKRVETAGGWGQLQLDCEKFVAAHPDGFRWLPPRTGAWVYPNPQTEPNNYYVTNFDFGPLPPALAALKPREIRYYPPNPLRLSGSESAPPVVQIKIFGMHSTDGNSIPFFGLEVVCGTTVDAESYRLDPSQDAVAGLSSPNCRMVTNRIFEVFSY